MAEFTVWAPNRSKMAVVVDGERHEMTRGERGWWAAEVGRAADGPADYNFELDGEKLLPDPRSRFQPQGVHGASRLVDTESFEWSDAGFQAPPLSSAIIYEMHVGTFTPQGTFESAMEKLPHLSRLGVTHVEFMPVVEFAGSRGWGYDGVYPYAPHHAYGGPRGLQRLVNACHAEGLAVILDVVYNHLGPAGNYLPQYGPYFSDRHETPWGSAINFDGPHSDEVRRFFIDNAKMWLADYRVDGLRLDAIHEIVDTSAVPFLEQLAVEVMQLEASLGRHLILIAESDLNDPRVIQSRERGGFGFDAQWSDDFHHALHVAMTGESCDYYCDFGGLSDLASVFRRPYIYDGRYSRFRQRSHGRSPVGLNGWKFLAYSQNHDQVGNRAVGERLHQLCGHRRAKIAAALTLFSPYVPLLFQGEEWAAESPFQYFVDFADDPILARTVSEGRRGEFLGLHQEATVPDPQDDETFVRSKLNWDELSEPAHRGMLQWYQQLIQLRRQLPSVVDGSLGDVEPNVNLSEQWLTIRRGDIWIVVNLAMDDRRLELGIAQPSEVVIASDPNVQLEGSSISLPAESVVVIRVCNDRGRFASSARCAGERQPGSTVACD